MSAAGMVARMIVQLLVRQLLRTLLAGAMACAGASVALAHTNLTRSDPGDGAILAETPAELRLWFDENISSFFSSTQILAADGRPVVAASTRIDRQEPTRMLVALPELPAGVYSALWRVLSESDGHVSRGSVVFGVGPEADPLTAVRDERGIRPSLPEVVLRWINFACLAALSGAVAVIALGMPALRDPSIVDQAIDQIRFDARRRILKWGFCCAVLTFAAGIGLLILQAIVLGSASPERSAPLYTAWLVLTETRWGELWMLRGAALIALGGVLLVLARQEPRAARSAPTILLEPFRGGLWSAAMLLAIALCALQVLSGHAAALTTNTDLALVAGATHILAAGVWAGGMTALSIGLAPLGHRGARSLPHLIQAGWQPFGRIAALSVALLFVTGVYSVGRQVASIDALLTTLYGQALLAKLALTLAMGAIGIGNAIILHPALLVRLMRRAAGWIPSALRRLPVLIRFEMVGALFVFLMVGVITATPPPKGPEFALGTESIVGERSQRVDDVVVTLSVKPNRAGHNAFSLFAASTVRPPPTKIERVLLRFNADAPDAGRTTLVANEVAPDRFLASGSVLGQAGPSKIEVIVRRRGMEDSVARFNWVVAPAGVPRPILVSQERLEPWLTFAAWVGALLVVMATWLARFMQSRAPRMPPELKTLEWRRMER